MIFDPEICVVNFFFFSCGFFWEGKGKTCFYMAALSLQMFDDSFIMCVM